MTLEWVATEARTGRVITDLPDLSVPRVGGVLGSYTTATATLPIPSAPEPWLRATTPKATTMLLLDDGVPVWGGLVLSRMRGSGDEVSLSLGTLEVWLDGVFIRHTLTYTGTGQNAIVADLCTRYVIDGTLPGLPLRVSGGTGGTARDRKYTDAMDKSILSALSELAGVEGGPEWTIGWEHLTGPERYTPVLYVGDRIGASPIAGLAPAATFEMPGAVTSVELTEDWSAGKGATDVIATSSAVADVRPQSPHQISADPDRPRVEHRFTPSTSISVVSTLTAHAARVLADMANGARTLSLTAVLSDAPRLGRVWTLGDDVGFVVGGPEDSSETVHVGDMLIDAGTTVRTNRMPNPACGTNVTGYGAETDVTRIAQGGGWAASVTFTAPTTPTYFFSPPVSDAVVGRFYGARVTLSGPAGRSVNVLLHDGVGYVGTALSVALIGVPQEVVVAPPAGIAATANFRLYVYPWEGLQAGDVLTMTHVFVEEVTGVGVSPGTYFDGDSADTNDVTYAWTGTSHASTSTETTQHVTLVPAHAETRATVRESVPAFPNGLRGTARAIGWEMTLPAAGVVGTITPTLVLPGESA